MLTIAELVELFENSELISAIGVIFLINMTLVVCEALFDYFGKKKRRWMDTLANVVIFIVGQIIEKFATSTISFLALAGVYYFVPWEIPVNWWTFVLALVAADFTYYWMHRIEHEHRILWALHSVHHSSEDYNLSISLRLSIFEGFIEWIFLVPMILIGFDPFITVVALIFVVQYQTWIHTEKIGSLGLLDKIFNTPSAHRVHHGSNRKYLDKNYGGVLLIWDHLFGTYQSEEEKVVYGLTRNIHTNNPLKINTVEFENIWAEVKRCRSIKDALRIIFGNLIWKPKYFKQNHDAKEGRSLKSKEKTTDC